MIRCPKCQRGVGQVSDSRQTRRSVRRRRQCHRCGHRWTTYECAIDFAEAGGLLSQLVDLGARITQMAFELDIGKPPRISGYKPVEPALNKRRRWTPDEDDAIRRLYPILGPRSAARIAGRSEGSISGRASRLGVRFDRRKAAATDCSME